MIVVALTVMLASPAAQSRLIREVAGEWITQETGGTTVVTHDGKLWKAKEGYPLALFTRPATFGNGSARVEFQLVDGGDDRTAGLVFGHSPQRYYYVRYNTKDGNVALWRMDGPKRTPLKHGEAHEQLERGAWHRLELVVDGRKIRASVNGKLHVEDELDVAPVGPLGLWVKPDSTTRFRSLTVTAR
jgi:hypothetical protein